jgi:hypothetical protein
VGDVPADRVVIHADGDVLDPGVEVRFRPLDQVLAHQPEASLIEAGEQDVVGPGGANRIVEGQRGVRIHHRPLRGHAELAQHGLSDVDPALGGRTALVDVDELADDRQVLRGDDGEVVRAGVRELATRRQQLAPARDLVEEAEDALHAIA